MENTSNGTTNNKKLFESDNKNDDNNKENSKENEDEVESFLDSKIFRIICVVLYLTGVSGLGFMVSIYHLFFWDSKMPQYHINKKG